MIRYIKTALIILACNPLSLLSQEVLTKEEAVKITLENNYGGGIELGARSPFTYLQRITKGLTHRSVDCKLTRTFRRETPMW